MRGNTVDYSLCSTPPRAGLDLSAPDVGPLSEPSEQHVAPLQSSDTNYESMLHRFAKENDLEAEHLAEMQLLQGEMLREREAFAGLIKQVRQEQSQLQRDQKSREDDLVSSLQSREGELRSEAQARESQLLAEVRTHTTAASLQPRRANLHPHL